jgi:ankyrin
MRTRLRPAVALAAFCTLVPWSIATLGAVGTPLIDAVRSRDVDRVKTLVKSRADVNAPQGDGATALHWAVHLDDAALVEYLLEVGARVDTANDLGVTPLYLSCTNRNGALTERLLKAGANPNAALPNGETVLMNCARTGSAQGVRALLAKGARVNDKESAHDQTALMWAAAQGQSEAVAALVQAGADLRARSRVYEQTVTSEVTQRAGREELNYTVKRGGMTPLLFAARSGDVESARILVDAGADKNETLPDGTPALTLAAYSGHTGVATLLLEKGADPNAAEVGFTALHAAVLRRDLELVKTLLKFKANPSMRMTKGTPMRRTSQDFDLPAVYIGATPFALAARYVEAEMVRELAKGGADTRIGLADGATPLMLAAGHGFVANADRRGLSINDGGKIEGEDRVMQTVTALLELGADVNETRKGGETALHIATQRGYNQVIKLLVSKGANVNARNDNGKTALGLIAGARRSENRRGQPEERESTADVLRALGATE